MEMVSSNSFSGYRFHRFTGPKSWRFQSDVKESQKWRQICLITDGVLRMGGTITSMYNALVK